MLVRFVSIISGQRIVVFLARAHFFGLSRLCCGGVLTLVDILAKRRARLPLEFLSRRNPVDGAMTIAIARSGNKSQSARFIRLQLEKHTLVYSNTATAVLQQIDKASIRRTATDKADKRRDGEHKKSIRKATKEREHMLIGLTSRI